MTTPATGSTRPGPPSRSLERDRTRAEPVTGGELLALALSLRARGLRGLDVLRRSQDRAPPPAD